MTDIESALTQRGSSSYADRLEAVRTLAGDTSPRSTAALVGLLGDDDAAVVGEAAGALLQRGEPGWREVVTASWRSEDTGISEAIRSAAVDRIIAGDPVEAILSAIADGEPASDTGKGAADLLVGLGMRPVAYLDED